MSNLALRSTAADLTVVTGAAGWLGRALVRAFTAHDSPLRRTGIVRALIAHDGERAALRDALGSDRADVEVVVGDITRTEVAERLFADAGGASVIHAAGVIHPSNVADFERVNVGGTSEVIRAASRAGARRLVFVSSNSPFGANPTPSETFRAEEPYAPYMGYGRSKMAAELLVAEAARAGLLEAVIVRPPWFYGPWQPERQTSFFRLVRQGRFPLMGGGRNRRSMVYIDNLVDGIDAADRVDEARGGAFWIADERPYEMNEVIAAVRAALTVCGVPPLRPQARVPALVGRLARTADGMSQNRGWYRQELHVLGEMDLTIACDISHSSRVLGYVPQVSLLEGMVRSVRWCLDRSIVL